MLSDMVYVTFHDALKAWYKEGKTHLTPQEICLSAKNLCDVILGLPDAQEGIDDELEDLEEEASCITEASGRRRRCCRCNAYRDGWQPRC